MTSCLLVYIVLELGSGGWTTLTETVAEGLLSIFLKKNHLDRVVGFRDTMVRQLAELGPFILGESATQWAARPMTWNALGRMAAEPGEGRQYGQSLGVCSPFKVLGWGASLLPSCSSTFWSADKGEACVHWFFIVVTKCLELGRRRIYFGLWFLRLHEARFPWACIEAECHKEVGVVEQTVSWCPRIREKEKAGKAKARPLLQSFTQLWLVSGNQAHFLIACAEATRKSFLLQYFL